MERNQFSAGRSQCSKVPRSPLQPVNAPLTSRSIVTVCRGGELDGAEEDRLIGARGLALDVAAIVEGQGELDGRITRQLAIGVAVPAVDRQQGLVDLVPTQPDIADPAVDLRLHVDAEDGRPRLVALVLDEEPLEVLAGRLLAARVERQAVAHGDEVRLEHLDRPVPPAQLGGQQVGRTLILLEAIPGRALGEPLQALADGQSADDRPEMRAAVRVIAFARRTYEWSPTVGK